MKTKNDDIVEYIISSLRTLEILPCVRNIDPEVWHTDNNETKIFLTIGWKNEEQ
jgi:hypothetical protein